MKRTVAVAVLLLGGCAIQPTENFRVWVLCYKDNTVLPNGMYTSNQLDYHCNKGGAGRSSVQFSLKIDAPKSSDPLHLKEHIKNIGD